MGLELEYVDPTIKNQNKTEEEPSQSASDQVSNSQENARLYTYYEDLIKQYTQKYNNANDKLALALILGRGFRPTVSKNRDLALLDVDKILSIKHKSLKESDQRTENMRLAADLTGLKNNLLIRSQVDPPITQNTAPVNRGNYQIFRLIRAAQMHYMRPARPPLQLDSNSDLDIVNNSVERIQGE